MKILITGGHLTPALAIIDELRSRENIEIIFVGRKYAVESEKTLSFEFKEIEKRGIKFIPLHAGRLTRFVSFRNLRSLLKIPLGFIQAFQILQREKPKIILSFGGYLALPVAIGGAILQIPVYTHEQTINPGLANRIIGIFAKKIFIAFEEAKKYFNSKKVVVTGNPVRYSIFKVRSKPFEIKSKLPVIYITGGSLGSHSINEHIKKIVAKLLDCYIVIHQTGDTKEYHDFEDLTDIQNKLPTELKDRYFLRKHFFDEEIGYIFSQSDLVIARAGANTFFELLYLQKPALFIPLPWSAHKEQQKHAQIFQKHKIGEIFNQSYPSKNLLELIEQMMANIKVYQDNFRKINLYANQKASETIVKNILEEI